MTSNVISTIVKNDLCIGCGVCASLCPDNSLEMRFNHHGEYNPTKDRECVKECGLCLKVCPFADGNDNEDSIGETLYGGISGICHRPETGFYRESYAGYAPDTRKRGASGGMATWLLSALLKKGIVDHLITVMPNDDPDQLFKFTIISGPEAVLDSSGSVYYPVELSDVLRQIQNNPGKYAIIGVPCFIKGIRLAQKRNKNLHDRIVICIGLICGQMKSRNYTSYIARLAGTGGALKKVHYRGKNPDFPTSNYFYFFENDKGDTKKIFWDNGISEAWLNRWFTPNPCNYCDDVFAECADIAFMDAWLPEYSEDRKGTNIVLVRSRMAQEVIDRGIQDGEILVDPISIEKVVQSQAGVIEIKRRHLAYQIYLGYQKGLKIPEKRVAPLKLPDPFLQREILIKNTMRALSREIWDSTKQDADQLRAEMQPYLIQLTKMKDNSGVLNFPLKVIRYIRRKTRGLSHE